MSPRQNQWRQGFLLLLVVFLPLALGGCWDRRELDQLAIVATAAADREQRLVQLTTEFFLPLGGGGGGMSLMLPTTGAQPRQSILATGSGYTLFAAIRDLNNKIPRVPFYAHTSAVLVGEDLAKHGLLEVLDFWNRDHETRRSTFLLLTHGPARALLITVQGALERTVGKEIQGLSRGVARSGYNYLPSIHQVINELESDAGATLLPCLILTPQTQPRSLSSLGPVQKESQTWREPSLAPSLRLQGAGLFRGERLVGWVEPRPLRGILWIKKEVHGGTITVKCGAKDEVSLEIKGVQSEVHSVFVGGQPQLQVQLRVNTSLAAQACPVDLSTAAALQHLAREGATAIRNEIEAGLAVAQKYQTDVFGFAGVIHREHPRQWRQLKSRWPQVFAQTPVALDIRVQVTQTGLTNKPLQTPGVREGQ